MVAYRYARRAEILGQSVYDHSEGAIVLNSGIAYPPLLPDVARQAAKAASTRADEVMQYGPLKGLDELRETICRYVESDGVICTPENVLITNGAKHAFELALRVFVEPGDRIIVTAPTYLTALQIMRAHGANLLAVPQDDEGMDAAILETKLKRLEANREQMPKILFDVPDFHNPTGVTMSLERRKRLIALAEHYGFIICEDDPYRRIRFEGTDVSPVKALDRSGVVIALGTVSKILAPGLRVGWAIAAKEIIDRMALQKSDGGSCPFTQRIVIDLMQSNQMADHTAKVSERMMLHRDTMVEALARELPELTINVPKGGYFLWAELPEGITAEALAPRALQYGVEISSGRLCFPEDDPGNFIRFSYSYVGPDEIVEGVRRLGSAFRELQAEA